jgi:gp16 family phage-associated protein
MSEKLKTREEVLADYSRKGISVSSWAKKHGLNPAVVHAVLKGSRQAGIGQNHKAAVLPGLKEGEIVDVPCVTFSGQGVAPSQPVADGSDAPETHEE